MPNGTSPPPPPPPAPAQKREAVRGKGSYEHPLTGTAMSRDGHPLDLFTPSQMLAKKYRTEIAASASSCLSTFIAFPLDSIKTRMQAYKFRSYIDCVMQTRQTEGMKGFWRGSLAPLASVTLVRTISFSIYSKSKQAYAAVLQPVLGAHRISPPNTVNRPYNFIYWFLSGATAGGAITFIACPFEFTKLSAQIELLMKRTRNASGPDRTHVPQYSSKGTYQSARDIVQARGFLGLYSGFRLHLLRDSLGTAMYFTFYETGKVFFSGGAGAGPLAIALSGGLCGLTSWAIIYPLDSAKSIFQRDVLTHRPGENLPRRPIRYNRRMYRGLGVSMLRSCILNSVFFSSYEYLKRQVDAYTRL